MLHNKKGVMDAHHVFTIVLPRSVVLQRLDSRHESNVFYFDSSVCFHPYGMWRRWWSQQQSV